MSEQEASDAMATQQGNENVSRGKGMMDKWRMADPVVRFTWTVITLIVVLFIWYVVADRIAPWTDQARVDAWIVPISPKVSGKVIKVTVEQDQEVKAGDLLAMIDPLPYELSLQRAEAALAIAGQSVGAATATVETAMAGVIEAKARLKEYEVQLARLEIVSKKGVISKAELDSARAERERAGAQLRKARAELEKAKQELGIQGENNPRLRDALAALGQAQIDLNETKIYAPADGGITNLKIDKGYYAKIGAPLMTFVAFDDVWIKANFRENSVGNIQKGDAVEIVLDMLPG
ncbi:MAG: biotin/lipoyl-binding protein, partial [Gammaproteobacteria bacterium]|nr:biotin/lipoyl-binding protein [Gammaproteobacteria bacterium]